MIEQSALNSGDLLKMTDLEDLNGAFYDIDAQDLLDVWEAMDSGTCESSGNFASSATNISWNGMFRPMQNTPVLKDKLLTDSMMVVNGEFPPVSTEHSYSLGRSGNGTVNGDSLSGNGAASDGDSIPESPLSLHDDMETECYPCIPMQSASNQKRRISSMFDTSSIKEEPFSPTDDDINVVDDDEYTDDKFKVRKTTTTNTTCSVKKQQQQNVNKAVAESKLPQLRQTVRLTRPKHPQSLLKHQPVVLMTTPLAGSSLQQQQQQQQQQHTSNNNCLQNSSVLTAAKLLSVAKEQQQQNTEYVYRSGCDWSSPVPSPSSSCSSSSGGNGKSVLNNNNNNNRTPIHTALISSQPDGCGELALTEEEKKTLISEGYPIPTRLPLSKAEERSLKKIRRKIKNKISAQESRRKKKEFVDTLERKVEEASAELGLYKKKCEHLQKENSALINQVKSLRAMLEQQANASQTFKIEPEDDLQEVISNEIDLD